MLPLVCQKSAAVELPPTVKQSLPPPVSRLRSMESGADRISNLLEGVLHHILSLLPARDAVRTCVLAQSWRDRWRSAPAIRFAYSTGVAGGIQAFAAFVDGLLRVRRGGPPLDSCDFDLDVMELTRPRFDLPAHGNSWIRRVLQLKVRELRFRLSSQSQIFRGPLELDDAPFSSRHLTSLELVGVDAIDLDLSGCPALQRLKMEESSVCSTSIGMSSPSVKHVSIKSCCIFPEWHSAMSFPRLVSFEFIKNSGNAPILQRMPYLETARIGFEHVDNDRCINGRFDDCGDDECVWCHFNSGRGCMFLQGLVQATHLNLSANPDTYVLNRDLKRCPPFNKLKTLVLSKWLLSTDLGPLIWFLHHAPLLEKLTLEISKECKTLTGTEGSYNPLENSTAPSHLQIVEIICEDVDGTVLRVFKVLNANGIPWWKIRIQCSGYNLY